MFRHTNHLQAFWPRISLSATQQSKYTQITCRSKTPPFCSPFPHPWARPDPITGSQSSSSKMTAHDTASTLQATFSISPQRPGIGHSPSLQIMSFPLQTPYHVQVLHVSRIALIWSGLGLVCLGPGKRETIRYTGTAQRSVLVLPFLWCKARLLLAPRPVWSQV